MPRVKSAFAANVSPRSLLRLVFLTVTLLSLAFPMGTLAAAGAKGGPDNSGGTFNNIVEIDNRDPGSTQVAGRAQFNLIDPEENDGVVSPQNAAVSWNTPDCKANCVTITVALQLDLVLPGHVSSWTPANLAWAYNDQCNHCLAMARACQDAQQIGDEDGVSPSLRRQFDALNRQLSAISRDPHLTQNEAIARFNDVIARYTELVQRFDPSFQCAPLPQLTG